MSYVPPDLNQNFRPPRRGADPIAWLLAAAIVAGVVFAVLAFGGA